ncbi:MAG: hypothetical protein QME96_08500 [Myxococcota bacterium]|nr:hypothetical protein [Myxococcota bacterium]
MSVLAQPAFPCSNAGLRRCSRVGFPPPVPTRTVAAELRRDASASGPENLRAISLLENVNAFVDERATTPLFRCPEEGLTHAWRNSSVFVLRWMPKLAAILQPIVRGDLSFAGVAERVRNALAAPMPVGSLSAVVGEDAVALFREAFVTVASRIATLPRIYGERPEALERQLASLADLELSEEQAADPAILPFGGEVLALLVADRFAAGIDGKPEMGLDARRASRLGELALRAVQDAYARWYEIASASFGSTVADLAFEVPADHDDRGWQAVADRLGLPPDDAAPTSNP